MILKCKSNEEPRKAGDRWDSKGAGWESRSWGEAETRGLDEAKTALSGKRAPASGGLQPLDYYQPL